MILDLCLRLTLALLAGWLLLVVLGKQNPRWSVTVTRMMVLACIVVPFVDFALPALELAILPLSESAVPILPPSMTEIAWTDRPQVHHELESPGRATTLKEVESSSVMASNPRSSSHETTQGVTETAVSNSATSHSNHKTITEASPNVKPPRKATKKPPESATIAPVESRQSPPFWDRPLADWLVLTWIAGTALLLLRLTRRLNRTRTLVRSSQTAPEPLLNECRELAKQLGLRQEPTVRISDSIPGPSTAGPFFPTILMPANGSSSLSNQERQAVLKHELAHVAGRDALWDALARLVVAVWWFHPFVWRLVSRHRLACEHTCDATAAGEDQAAYRRMLARWALRRQSRESAAALLAIGDRTRLMRRLRWLESPRPSGTIRPLRWALFGIAALFFVVGVAAITPIPQAVAKPPVQAEHPASDGEIVIRRPDVADIDTSRTTPQTIRVVNADEKPIAGAAVRVSWWEDLDGDMLGRAIIDPPVTNKRGEVTIAVPAGAVRARISAEAEGYASAGKQYSLAGVPTLTLKPGRIIRVKAIDANGQPLPEAYPLLEDSHIFGREFKPVPDHPGVFVSPVVSLDRRWMRVVTHNPDTSFLYSELIDVTDPEHVNEDGTIVATLRPGIRLEGKLDPDVPRPIEHGCVELYIQEGASHRILQNDGWTWQDTAIVQEDGSFVFESLPAGGHVQLVALVDGYQSTKPTAKALRSYFNKHNAGDTSVIDLAVERNDAYWPHLFPLPIDEKVVHVELPCAQTAALDVTVVDPAGRPIAAATVNFNPNGLFLGGELFIPATTVFTSANVVRKNGDPLLKRLREWAAATFLHPETNAKGVAQVRNLPRDHRAAYEVEAEGYIMPIHPTSSLNDPRRYALVELVGGETLSRTITMERFVPRAPRRVLVVNQDAEPVPEITVTINEIAFTDAPNQWALWSVQRFGPVASDTTEEDGIAQLQAPVSVDDRTVARLRVSLAGRFAEHGFVQREQVAIPREDDGNVLVLTLADEVPEELNAFRDVLVESVDPKELLTESPKELLQKLVKSPSLVVLKQLLAAADFDEATPLRFLPHRNLLTYEENRSPVVAISTDNGDRVVALCHVRPKDAAWEVKPNLQSPPETAFVFDPADGSLIAMIGGWASSGGSYSSMFFVNLGDTNDYFLEVSAFEDHGPFEYIQHWHRLGRVSEPVLTTYGYANATGWGGDGDGPSDPPAEFSYLTYEFNSEDIDNSLPGTAPSGALVPRKIYWDGSRNTFIGPPTQSFDGKPLYKVVAEQSAAFEPLMVEPSEMVVAGGRMYGKNRFQWDVIIPKGQTAQLRLLLIDQTSDDAAPKELASRKISSGLHFMSLLIKNSDDTPKTSAIKIAVDKENVLKQPSHTVPRIPINGRSSVPDKPVARTAASSADLLRRPTANENVWLVWRLELL